MTGSSPVAATERAPNFDHLAGAYRWLEWFSFGPWLSRTRRAFLSEMGGSRSALVIGDGDGRFTAALLRANPNIKVDAVDASPAMLAAVARRTAGHREKVRIHLADAREWKPAAESQYDLVVTHFFLDCLTTEEVRLLGRAVCPALCPGAWWIVSEFDIPEGWFGRLIAAPLIGALYTAFRLLTGLRVRRLPDHREALTGAGFRKQETRRFLGGLLVSERWASEPSPPGGPDVTSVLKSGG